MLARDMPRTVVGIARLLSARADRRRARRPVCAGCPPRPDGRNGFSRTAAARPVYDRLSPSTLRGVLIVPSVRRCAAALSLLLLAGAAGSPALETAAAVETPTAGSHGIGDAYFPKDGNGGYDVAPLRHPRHLPAPQRRPHRAHHGHGDRDPGPVVAQPRPDAHAGRRPGERCARDVREGRQARAHRHPRHAGRRRRGAGGRGPLPRHAAAAGLGRRAAVPGRARRGGGDEPAAHRALVVPGQRPPAGQGALRHHASRSPAATRWSATARWSGAAPPAPGRRGTGARAARWRRYLAFFAAGRFRIESGTTYGAAVDRRGLEGVRPGKPGPAAPACSGSRRGSCTGWRPSSGPTRSSRPAAW